MDLGCGNYIIIKRQTFHKSKYPFDINKVNMKK